MIVQSSPTGEPHFMIRQVDHARMAGQFAEAFGNDQFARLDPRELMVFVTAHHDEGWAEYDGRPVRDPGSGLPYTFFETPRAYLTHIHQRSPDFNERHHPL